MDNNTIGDRVRSLRGRKTLAEFAENLGVGGSQISAIETGRSKMSFELAERICDIYSCTMDWLIRGVGTRDGSPVKADKEPSDSYITIKKDELLDLYKKLNKKQEDEIRQGQEQIEELQKQIQVKNIDKISN